MSKLPAQMELHASASTGLATSWHHFTWPPPQHQATQTHERVFCWPWISIEVDRSISHRSIRTWDRSSQRIRQAIGVDARLVFLLAMDIDRSGPIDLASIDRDPAIDRATYRQTIRSNSIELRFKSIQLCFCGPLVLQYVRERTRKRAN